MTQSPNELLKRVGQPCGCRELPAERGILALIEDARTARILVADKSIDVQFAYIYIRCPLCRATICIESGFEKAAKAAVAEHFRSNVAIGMGTLFRIRDACQAYLKTVKPEHREDAARQMGRWLIEQPE